MLGRPGKRAHARLARRASCAACATLLLLASARAHAEGGADPRAVATFAAEGAAPSTSPLADSLAAFPSPRVRAWQVGLARPDRLEHAGLSFTLAAALTLAFQDRAAAAGVTLALGAGKEWWDSRHSHAEALDLVADAVGVGLAVVLIRGRP
jgi:hypothetical protein